MVGEVDISKVEDFKSEVIYLVEQDDSRVYSQMMMRRTEVGQVHTFPRITRRGLELREKTGQRTDTQYQDTIRSNRTVNMGEFYDADTIETQELQRILVDQFAALPKELGAEVNRFRDKICYTAALGVANTVNGKSSLGNRTYGTVALPDTQVVGVSVGGNESGLSVAKLNEAKSIFEGNEVVMEKLMLFTNSEGLKDLRNDTVATNSDYITGQPISTGQLGMLLGMDIIMYNFINGDGTPADPYQSVVLTPMALGIVENPTPNVQVDQIPQQRYMWQWYVELNLAAVRLQEELVVRIDHIAQ